MIVGMLSTTNVSHAEAVALMELVNRRLLDGRLARMRLRYRTGRMVERRVLDNQALSRLMPDLALVG